ncbi:MAG: histidine triad nucleotide-binding protein [Terriglobales bacterium]
MDCLFCRIVAGAVPARKVYEDDCIFAFEDIRPGAPTHVLLVPKRHVAGLAEAQAGDAALLGALQLKAAELARSRGLADGYRTVFNVGPDAGQSVDHLHLHLLGGRPMAWPPG